MAAVQLPMASRVSTGSSNSVSFVSHDLKSKEFPTGLRVLVVDDDLTCLMLLRQMLEKCLYEVTTCSQATIALSLLREKKGGFDVVISDVHMPDMDGFMLLEHVGLEMDLPVIMMSADARTNIVMRGIQHGACDYLIKPIRFHELKNIWQHVVRKNSVRQKEAEYLSNLEDSDCLRRVPDDAENGSSGNDGVDGTCRSHKNKRDAKGDEDSGELESDDPSLGKKARVVWSVELHEQFVHAVNQLGIDRAVPKRILELMNVPGLTRENVASHLQKFRLYLKRMNETSEQQAGNFDSYHFPRELNVQACSLEGLNFHPVAASVQIPSQTLASMNAELLGQPTVALPSIDHPVHLRGSVQETSCDPLHQGASFGPPLLKCQTGASKQLSQSNIAVEHIPSTFSASRASYLSCMSSLDTLGGVTDFQNANIQMHGLHQQRSRPLSDLHQAINLKPSFLLVPTQASNSFQIEDNVTLINNNSITVAPLSSSDLVTRNDSVYFHQSPDPGNIFMENRLIPSQTDNASLDGGQISDGGLNSIGMLNRFPISRSFSSAMASCTARTGSSSWRVQTPPASTCSTTRLQVVSNADTTQGPGIRSVALPNKEQGQRLVSYGKGANIPSGSAVDDIESHDDLGHRKTCDDDGVSQDCPWDFIHSAEYSGSTHFMK